jgi:hypothetical protein
MAREVLLNQTVSDIESPEDADKEFNDHIFCSGLESRCDLGSMDDDDHDILESEEEDIGTLSPENMDETDVLGNENAASSELPLHREAEEGLREILLQFHVNPAEMEEIIGSFQNYIAAATTDLCLKPLPKKNRYGWIISKYHDEIHETLSDIAQRLEALVCNEAITERTNSAMKRMLSPFRLRMSSRVLLSRMTIARHGNAELPKADGSISSGDQEDSEI